MATSTSPGVTTALVTTAALSASTSCVQSWRAPKQSKYQSLMSAVNIAKVTKLPSQQLYFYFRSKTRLSPSLESSQDIKLATE